MITFAHFYPIVSGSGRILSAPRPLVICGPSGSGKSTLLKKLLAEFGEYFGFSVSRESRRSCALSAVSSVSPQTRPESRATAKWTAGSTTSRTGSGCCG